VPGQIRSFSLNAKLGRDTPLIGDLPAAPAGEVIYLETNRCRRVLPLHRYLPAHFGGQMWVAFDPPDADSPAGRHPQRSRFRRARRESARQHRRQRPRPAALALKRRFQRMRVDFTACPAS